MQSSSSPPSCYFFIVYIRTFVFYITTVLQRAFMLDMHACRVIIFMYNTLLSLISTSAFYVPSSSTIENWLFTLKGTVSFLYIPRNFFLRSFFCSIPCKCMYCVSIQPFHLHPNENDRMCILERVKVAKKVFSYRQVSTYTHWVSRLNILFCFN